MQKGVCMIRRFFVLFLILFFEVNIFANQRFQLDTQKEITFSFTANQNLNIQRYASGRKESIREEEKRKIEEERKIRKNEEMERKIRAENEEKERKQAEYEKDLKESNKERTNEYNRNEMKYYGAVTLSVFGTVFMIAGFSSALYGFVTWIMFIPGSNTIRDSINLDDKTKDILYYASYGTFFGGITGFIIGVIMLASGSVLIKKYKNYAFDLSISKDKTTVSFTIKL